MRIDYGLLGGGAAAGVVADYLDVKTTPVSTRVTNSELLAGAAIVAQSLHLPALERKPLYAQAVNGAAGWAAGILAAGIARRHLLPPATTTPAPTTTTKSVPANPATSTSGGVTGVPASGGSAAFDMPAGGY